MAKTFQSIAAQGAEMAKKISKMKFLEDNMG